MSSCIYSKESVQQFHDDFKVLEKFKDENPSTIKEIPSKVKYIFFELGNLNSYDASAFSSSMTPLGYAVSINCPSLVNLLVKGGANVNVGSFYGYDKVTAPLFYLKSIKSGEFSRESRDQCIDILTKAGSSPNVPPDDYRYRSLISIAACNGDVELIQSLVNAKADIDFKSNYRDEIGPFSGYTPLQTIFISSRPLLSTVKKLVELGADLLIGTPPPENHECWPRRNLTIRDLAKLSHNSEITKYLEDKMSIKVNEKTRISFFDFNIPTIVDTVNEYAFEWHQRDGKAILSKVLTSELKNQVMSLKTESDQKESIEESSQMYQYFV